MLLMVFTAIAQERPRYFDNFDTSKGVQVVSQQTISNGSKPAIAAKEKGHVKHYLPSPPHGSQNKNAAPADLVRKTAQVTMRASDGFAEPERRGLSVSPNTMRATNSQLKGLSTGDLLVDSYIVDSSHRYGIDPLLIYAQMAQESSFKRQAKSHKGASGLMQLMPATARRLGVTNIYDPQQNIEGGVKYMRMLLNMFDQDMNLALAGYNAGEGAVIKYGYRIPPYNETQDYVRRISAKYQTLSAPTTARSSNRSIRLEPSFSGLR